MLVKMQKEDKVTYEKREKNGGRYRKGKKMIDKNIMGKKRQKKSRLEMSIKTQQKDGWRRKRKRDEITEERGKQERNQ